MKLTKIIVVILSITTLLLSSCVKDIDTAQAENAAYTTPLIMPLVYLQLNQSDFLDTTGAESLYIVDETDLVIDSSILSSIKPTVTLKTKTTNTFARNMYCELIFVDAYGTDLVNKVVVIPANVTNFTADLSFSAAEVVLMKQMSRVRTELFLNTGTPLLQPTDSYVFNFQSALYFNVGYPN